MTTKTQAISFSQAILSNISRFAASVCLLVGVASGLRAQSLNKISVSPTSVPGGTSSTGTVTLTAKAGASGKTISLTASNPNAVVPPYVTVNNGSKTATFTITTSAVATNATATIKGKLGSASASATLRIISPELHSISVNPSSVNGGSQATGTVTLSSPAPSSGIKVSLSSRSTSASVPSSVTVPQGSTNGTFTIKTQGATTPAEVTLRAYLASVSKSTTITVLPVTLTGLSFNPATVVGGTSTSGVVTLSSAVQAPTNVSLTSGSLSATVPTEVTVPKGSATATFQVTTTTVTAATTATVSATLGSMTQSSALSINILDPISTVTGPTAILGGNTGWANITLAAPAGPGGVVVSLTSSTSAALLPSAVTIPAGQSGAQIDFNTTNVSEPTPVTITAYTDGSSQSMRLNIDPAFQISVNPSEFIGGDTAVGTITVQNPAPTGGLSFALTSWNINATLTFPASVTIPAGAKSVTFQVGSGATSGGFCELTATDSDGLYNYIFFNVDAALGITRISLSQNSVSGGAKTSVIVTVNNIAPAGGYVVKLASSEPSIGKVPMTLTIPQGSSTGSATITTSAVSSFQSSIISATFAGSSLTTQLWVTQALPGTTYTLLNPDAWSTSYASAVSGTSQGGSVRMTNSLGDTLVQHAAAWSGTKSSFVDLHPSSWIGSIVEGVYGNTQVGNVYEIDGSGHAALWNGTTASFMDLNPPGDDSSTAYAISGSIIVGNAGVGLNNHAVMWTGSNPKAIDLVTDGSLSSAVATDGHSIVGYFGPGWTIDSSALLWTSLSAESLVNLSPTGWSASAALGVSGNVQVGWVGNLTWSTGGGMPYPNIYGPYAARWTGSSSSYVSLDVPGDINSSANAVSGDITVGYVQCSGGYGLHAALWLDSASTFIDLVALAGQSWKNASATSVYSDSTGITISGYCDQGAIVWHIPASDLPKLRGAKGQRSRSPLLP